MINYVEKLEFEKAIAEYEEDYQLKLVFADWLEERGSYGEADFWRWVVKSGFRPLDRANGNIVFPATYISGQVGPRYGDIPNRVFDNLLTGFLEHVINCGDLRIYKDYVSAMLAIRDSWVSQYDLGWRV